MKPNLSRFQSRLIYACLFSVLMLNSNGQANDNLNQIAYTQASLSNLRADISTEAEIVKKLPINTVVNILSKKVDWVFIQVTEGKSYQGWLHQSLLAEHPLSLLDAVRQYKKSSVTDLSRLQWIERAAAVAPENIDVLGAFIKTLESLGEYERAEQVVKSLVKLKAVIPKTTDESTSLAQCKTLETNARNCRKTEEVCITRYILNQDSRNCQDEENACYMNIIDQVSECESVLTNNDIKTDMQLLEIHKALLNVSISTLDRDECPEYFTYQEGWASCVYRHEFLERLRVQFPDSIFLPEAAWLSAQRVYKHYECEGNWDCIIESNLYPPRWFLEQYPNSPYSDQAVDSVLDTIDQFDEVDSSKYSFSEFYGVAEEIRALKILAPHLDHVLSDKLLSGLALLESRLKNQLPKTPDFYEPDWLRARSLVKYPDCQGHWDCIIENHLYSPRWYLERHPGSPYKEKSIKWALEAIDLLDEMDFSEYGFSQTDNLSKEIKAYKRLLDQTSHELTYKLQSGLERLEFHLEVENLFDEIITGNPSRNPSYYLSYAREELIEKFLQSNMVVAPEPKDEWMLVLFEVVEKKPSQKCFPNLMPVC